MGLILRSNLTVTNYLAVCPVLYHRHTPLCLCLSLSLSLFTHTEDFSVQEVFSTKVISIILQSECCTLLWVQLGN